MFVWFVKCLYVLYVCVRCMFVCVVCLCALYVCMRCMSLRIVCWNAFYVKFVTVVAPSILRRKRTEADGREGEREGGREGGWQGERKGERDE